ncbi:MaoC family dehydratase [Amycolatopsis acidiphila]|uniref:MaoC family dehydratase n=1 Tax=Amycolatopsis acidiphila TaxID=715473 RepID=A0A558A304_9PSEU|nr:MaoC family dehydratase [Amycolatopsis acidiphila]TVT18632.1 MaoC family dehydratase [Amycolatopsis acidiphila]UIJ56613.1 MaoC family dehydratase [Amycolatopsis acidiphila]GHG66368.1 MaoC family dehydratase [Amycolatopsis acidiphila]
MRVFASLDEFAAAAGEQLGTSEWHTVTQEQVDTFAEATGDHQWIHVDVEKAKQGPFGGPIAHGFLTLSLLPRLSAATYRVDGLKMGINYGLNKVRFPMPVKVGAKVRGTAELAEITDVPGGKQAVVRWTVEIDGEQKPACIAEFVVRLLA